MNIAEFLVKWFTGEPIVTKPTDNITTPVILPIIVNNNIFTPTNFSEYIGQTKAKNILQAYMQAVKQRNITMPHILLYGSAGCGKTTLAKLIANELNVKFIETITGGIKDFYQLGINIDNAEGGILFLDEIHALDRALAEQIYPIIETFTFGGYKIQPFTLIGATTELGEILKDRKPLYDRFKIIIELENYNITEIKEIIKQYNIKLFNNELLTDNILDVISINSRVTPRTALRLLEATIYLNGNIDKVLNNFNIIKDGYTNKDLKILQYIAKNEKGVGLSGLASYLDTSQDNYIYEIEPYLLKNDLIIRTARGRKITEKGLEKIKELII